MKLGPDISRLAALIGDPARANMISALMGGCALTAGELAQEAGVTPQTASSHLAKLADGGLVVPRRQGRPGLEHRRPRPAPCLRPGAGDGAANPGALAESGQ